MIPDSFPALFLDRAFYALRQIGEMVIQIEAVFPHRLDVERLEKATQAVMDAEPILGCCFDPTGEHGNWRRLPLDKRQGLSIAANAADYEARRTAPLVVESGPLLQVCLRSDETGDHLLMRVAHEVADAGAVKDIAVLLSSIYTRLSIEPDYQPAPNLDGDRDLDQVLRCLPWTARFPIMGALVKEGMTQSFGRRFQTLSLEVEDRSNLRFMTRSFSKEQVVRLSEFGRRYDATLNDLFMTAFLRALAEVTKWNRETRLALNMTADLRRYLPKGVSEGICNLSGIETFSIGRKLEERFKKTLQRVRAGTKARKRSWIGLNVYGSPLLNTLQKMSLNKYQETFAARYALMTQKGKVAPTLTNMGPIPDIDLDGGPTTCHLLAPPMFPPGVNVGLSGNRGTLTLCAATYSSGIVQMEALLDATSSQLMSQFS